MASFFSSRIKKLYNLIYQHDVNNFYLYLSLPYSEIYNSLFFKKKSLILLSEYLNGYFQIWHAFFIFTSHHVALSHLPP